MRYQSLATATLGVFVFLVSSNVASASQHQCTANKTKATANKAFKKLKCHSKAASQGVAVDAQCLTDEEVKFDEKFTKAETKPPCFAIGDAAAMEAKVDVFIDDIEAALRPVMTASKCSSKKLSASGKKVKKLMGCYKKAISKGENVDATCLSGVGSKFIDAFGKAEDAGDCLTLTDAIATEATIDAFVDDAMMELRPITPTACSSRKVDATGDKARGKLRCYDAAVRTGSAVNATCLTNEETQFSNAWASAESQGDCLTTGDEVAMEAKVDAFVDDVVVELAPVGGPSVCSSSKIDEAGKKAQRKLQCYRVAYADGLPVSAACLTDAEVKFSDGFAKAESKGDCETVSDEVAIEAKVDAFVDDATTELLP